jgi:hypothetical protein
VWGTGDARLAQIEDASQENHQQSNAGGKKETRPGDQRGARDAVTPEKPYDCGPTPHDIPQMPKKNCQLPRDASL